MPCPLEQAIYFSQQIFYLTLTDLNFKLLESSIVKLVSLRFMLDSTALARFFSKTWYR